MPHPRVVLIQLRLRASPRLAGSSSSATTSSGTARSTWCFETPDAASLHVGDVLYGMPWHVCPTVALHGQAVVVRDGRAVGVAGSVTARERRCSTGLADACYGAARVPLLAALVVLVTSDRARPDARVSGADDRVAGAGARRGPASVDRRHRVPARRRQHARVHRGRHRPGHVHRRRCWPNPAAPSVVARAAVDAVGERWLPLGGRGGWLRHRPADLLLPSGSCCSSPSSSGWPPPSGRPLLTLALPLVAGLSASHGLVRASSRSAGRDRAPRAPTRGCRSSTASSRASRRSRSRGRSFCRLLLAVAAVAGAALSAGSAGRLDVIGRTVVGVTLVTVLLPIALMLGSMVTAMITGVDVAGLAARVVRWIVFAGNSRRVAAHRHARGDLRVRHAPRSWRRADAGDRRALALPHRQRAADRRRRRRVWPRARSGGHRHGDHRRGLVAVPVTAGVRRGSSPRCCAWRSARPPSRSPRPPPSSRRCCDGARHEPRAAGRRARRRLAHRLPRQRRRASGW